VCISLFLCRLSLSVSVSVIFFVGQPGSNGPVSDNALLSEIGGEGAEAVWIGYAVGRKEQNTGSTAKKKMKDEGFVKGTGKRKMMGE
jgi:hypothetical protein